MKMKLLTTLCISLLCVNFVQAEDYEWVPKGAKIKTVWAEALTPDNAWQSYPRPKLQRDEWQNLNGLWSYAVTKQDILKAPSSFDGKILVPYAIESSLSGVQRTFLPDEKLWYSRTFTVNALWKGKDVILHFGAVDYQCRVWLNGKLIGDHIGGNNSFSFNVSKYIKLKGENVIEISVVDPTDTESISRGKQQLNQNGIWYTPVSGIWKTVWMEAVNKQHITSIEPKSDIKNGEVTLCFDAQVKGGENLRIKVWDGEKLIKESIQSFASKVVMDVPNPVLWSPQTPKLYTFTVELLKGTKVLDKVKSYFALREISVLKDECGYNRFALNGEAIFQYGTLDQGWWPDGLLTPPSEEAMLWDMAKLKEMGFNTIRKHIKVEPELYYYYADSLGIMIWQDMVSAFATNRKVAEYISPYDSSDWDAPVEHTKQWLSELYEMIDDLKFYQSITTWVVFNEGWGQTNTKEIVNDVIDYDRSRIVNGVSGWTDRKVGNVYDVHNYPVTSMILPEYNDDRVSVLGEFGGYGLAIKEHLWNPDMRNWGYKNIDGGLDLLSSYTRVIYDLESLIPQGLSGAIYTQTTDVEGEVNGLITYDRKLVKVPVDIMHIMHDRLYKARPSRTIVLIDDAQDGDNKKKSVIKGGETKVSYSKFQVDNTDINLSLWLCTATHAKVWLNGKLVFNQKLNQTRHYNQYNISDYSQYLKKGDNELKIEVKNNWNRQVDFDYGLRSY